MSIMLLLCSLTAPFGVPRTPRTPHSASRGSRLRTSSSDAAVASRPAALDDDGKVASGGEGPSMRLAAVMVLVGAVSYGLRQLGGASGSMEAVKQHRARAAEQKTKEEEQRKKKQEEKKGK